LFDRKTVKKYGKYFAIEVFQKLRICEAVSVKKVYLTRDGERNALSSSKHFSTYAIWKYCCLHALVTFDYVIVISVFVRKRPEANPERGDWSNRSPLKPTKVSLFTILLYNSENSIRDIRPFCRPLFCHNMCCEVYFISHTVVNH